MAKEKRTREERRFDRDVRQDTRRSERYDNKRERRGRKISEVIAEDDKKIGFKKQEYDLDKNLQDPGYKKKAPITVVMRDKQATRLNDGSLSFDPGSVEAYSKDNTQEAVDKAVRTQLDYKASLGEIDAKDNTQLANGAIKSEATSAPTAGAAIISAIGNNSNATMTDMKKLPDAATAVNASEKQDDNAIANNAVNANNGIDAESATDAAQVGNAIGQQQVDNTAAQAEGAVDGGVTPAAGTTGATGATGTEGAVSAPVGGDGSTAVQQMQGGGYGFAQNMTKNDVKNQITNGAFTGFSNTPVTAIEKLDAIDYFPNAGKDINVGSYSGKYLGNATIFAAPGARIPFGLFDAHMRSLKEAAADRQKAIDKILTAPQTAEQYQQVFDDYFFSGVEGLREKYGDDPNAILSSPEGARFFANANAIARDYTKAVSMAESTLKTYSDNKTYLPDNMRDKCLEVLYATGDDWKKAMNGEGSLINSLNAVLSYVNVMPQIEEYATEALKPANLTQMPINLKTGGEYDSDKFVAEREDFFLMVKNGGIQEGSNEYVEGIKKYFTGDYVKSITAICAAQNVSEEQTQDAIKYFEGRIPKESIELKYKSIDNNAMAQAELAERRRQFNLNRQDKKENESYARTIHEVGSIGDPGTGKTFNQEIAALNASGVTGAELKRRQEALYKLYFGVQDGKIEIDGNGTYVTYVPVRGATSEPGDPRTTKIGVSVKNADGSWGYKTLTASEIASSSENYYMGGKPIKNTDYANIKLKPVNTEVRVAFINRQTGKQEYLKADGSNNAAYEASAESGRITYATIQHQAYIQKSIENKATGDEVIYYSPVPGFVTGETINIANAAGQQYLDRTLGYTAPKAAEAQGVPTTSTTTINSSNQ
jgi:hypothetical protein